METKFSLDSGDDINFLEGSFPELEFNLYKAKINESSFFSVISCCIDNEETLSHFWERINNLIGTEYLPTLNEFSSWNIYLALLSSEKIGNALKYTIENDTFFVRKIIFDHQVEHFTGDRLAKLLNNKILGDDISVDTLTTQVSGSELKYSKVTQDLLSAALPLGRTSKDNDLRNTWLDNAILEVDNHEV